MPTEYEKNVHPDDYLDAVSLCGISPFALVAC